MNESLTERSIEDIQLRLNVKENHIQHNADVNCCLLNKLLVGNK